MLADIVAKTLKQRATPAGPAAAAGRNGDAILAHISPEEAALLKRRGGSGTINPTTGVMEFFEGAGGGSGGLGTDWSGGFGYGNTDFSDPSYSGQDYGGDYGNAVGPTDFGGFGLAGPIGYSSTPSGSSLASALGPTAQGSFSTGGITGSGNTYGAGTSTSSSAPAGSGYQGSTSTGYSGGESPGSYGVPGNEGFNGFGTAMGDASLGGFGGFGMATGDPAMGGANMSPAGAGEVGAGTATGAGEASNAAIPADGAQTQGVGFGGWNPFGQPVGENVNTGRPTNGATSFGFGALGMGNLPQSGALLSTTVEDGPVYGLPETYSPAAGLRGMAADPTGRHPGGPGDDDGGNGSVTVGGGAAAPGGGGSVTTDRGPASTFGFGAGMSGAKGLGYSNPQGPGPGAWGSSGRFASSVPDNTTVAQPFTAGTPIADAAARAYAANPGLPHGYLEGMYGVESRYGTMADRKNSAFSGPYQQDRTNIERFAGKGANPKDPEDATRAVVNEYNMGAGKVGRNLTPAEAFTVHNQGMTYSPQALQNPNDLAKEWWDAGNIRANNRNPNMTVADFVKSWEPNYFEPRLDYANPQGFVNGIDSAFFK